MELRIVIEGRIVTGQVAGYDPQEASEWVLADVKRVLLREDYQLLDARVTDIEQVDKEADG